MINHCKAIVAALLWTSIIIYKYRCFQSNLFLYHQTPSSQFFYRKKLLLFTAVGFYPLEIRDGALQIFNLTQKNNDFTYYNPVFKICVIANYIYKTNKNCYYQVQLTLKIVVVTDIQRCKQRNMNLLTKYLSREI